MSTENPTAPKVEMYTTAICPYCVSAKNLLRSKGLEYTELRVDSDADQRATMLQRSGGKRSVPQIFVNDVHVGGFDDLVAADRNGRLAEIIGSHAKS